MLTLPAIIRDTRFNEPFNTKDNSSGYLVTSLKNNGETMSMQIIETIEQEIDFNKNLTGMGLIMVKDMVKELGGELFIKSDIILGT